MASKPDAVPLSGTQYSISHGDYAAEIASVGATLRSFTFRGRNLIVPFDAEELRPAYRGAILSPWPNRIVNGSYAMNGQTFQLPLTEPARGHALHGLCSWLNFISVGYDSAGVSLRATIEAQQGYPWRIEMLVHYWINDSGLHAEVSAKNVAGGAAPYGVGSHAYLLVEGSELDSWDLSLPAAAVLNVSSDRLVPLEIAPVEEGGGIFDFNVARKIGATKIDHAFTELKPDREGKAVARLTGPSGHGVAMSWNARLCDWLQIHTADTIDPRTNRIGLAVEPMSCPPNAFNSKTGLTMIETGEVHSASWTISAIVA